MKIKLNHQLEKLVQNKNFTKKTAFDYSKGRDSLVDKALQGNYLTMGDVLFEGEENPYLKENCVKRNKGDVYDSNKYQILFLPVGFNERVPEELFVDLIEKMNESFKFLPIQFSYLCQNYPIEVSHVDRFPFVTDKRKNDLLSLFRTVTPVDGISLALNSEKRYGGGGKFALFSLKEKYSKYVLAHELGHHFCLNDGYERYYQSANGTELFTALSHLPKPFYNVVRRVKPPIYKTGNHFDGKAVYRFYETSIMVGGDIHFSNKIDQGKEVFNDLQKTYMEWIIKRRFKSGIFP